MKKRLFTMLLILSVMFTMCFSTGVAYAAEEPEGTPIYTVEDLKNMENNPSGSYYLAADIQLPENFTIFKYEYLKDNYFTGTLDGNGYKLIGYTVNHNGGWYEGAFVGGAKGATLKNLHFTDVNVNLNSDSGVKAAVVLGYAPEACTLSKITMEGNVHISGKGDYKYFEFGGLSYYLNGTATSCYNKMNITADVTAPSGEIEIAGISTFVTGGPIKSCRNYGDITVNAKTDAYTKVSVLGIASSLNKFTSCRNTGDLMVTFLDGCKVGGLTIAGIADNSDETMTSCYNTGKITAKDVKSSRCVSIAGVVAEGATVNKCYNKGTITLNGTMEGNIGGVAALAANTTKSYNKGKINVTADSGNMAIGGVVGYSYGMKNCYNTGAITLKQENYDSKVGGLAGHADIWAGSSLTSCYATGKITAYTWFKGTLLGSYTGADVDRKRNIYNNYYTGSAKPYGVSEITWKDWTAKATKVSAITASSCPKLSTKTWSYSKDKKRLILKDNKEK